MGGVVEQVGPEGFISTGSLPAPDEVQRLIEEAWVSFRDDADGQLSEVYPALTGVPDHLFGVALVDTSGRTWEAGDTDSAFPIMSVSKPFVFALVCQALGPSEARSRLGANATGRAFNSLAAIEASSDGRTNPMVNPGAIMTTSLVGGATPEEQWHAIHRGLSAFAGRDLPMDEEILESALATNFRNRGTAWMLHGLGQLAGDPLVAVDLYTRQCSLAITARDLAVMGATLADGGVNPVTRERVVDPMVCHYTLAVMATAGLYETSGDWL
ncbi:MAG TPA: glutaminase, partial [Thermomicrobiales bacterium]|nr:glutaminase [Thermomicrobiales bacterium]